ncbi:hypothetical protein MBLNU459_g1938t1 [Dothideomycetes sp. NU459]
MVSQTTVRTFMRSFKSLVQEAHPFERNTSTLLPHKHDNIQLMRRLGRTAVTFFPFYAVILGWPFAVKSVLNRTGI